MLFLCRRFNHFIISECPSEYTKSAPIFFESAWQKISRKISAPMKNFSDDLLIELEKNGKPPDSEPPKRKKDMTKKSSTMSTRRKSRKVVEGSGTVKRGDRSSSRKRKTWVVLMVLFFDSCLNTLMFAYHVLSIVWKKCFAFSRKCLLFYWTKNYCYKKLKF